MSELTPEEIEKQIVAEQQERDRNASVLIAGVRCHCGLENDFRAEPFWLFSQDQVEVTCANKHLALIRFVPESVTL